MKGSRSSRGMLAGSSLVEVVLAMGVLAVVMPLVFAVLAKSGQGAASAQAETRSTWIIPACMDEITAAREGRARFLPQLARGQPFPGPNEILALGFAADGRVLGRVGRDAYLTGSANLAGAPVRYVVSLRAEPCPATSNTPAMLYLHLALEYPAAVPLTKRRKLDFHTRIP